MDEKEKVIRVFVRGGCVNEVDNLPEDYDWKLIDYDCRDDCSIDDCSIEGECGTCDKAETCFTYNGSPTCEWVLYKEERERREKELAEQRKIATDRNQKLTKYSELFKSIIDKYNVPSKELSDLCELENTLAKEENI